jgi:cell wall-associated NlpC family hydrolase
MKKFIISFSLLSLFSINLYADILLTVGERRSSDIDYMPKNEIADTNNIVQDTTPFTQQITPMTNEEQLYYDEQYNQKYFEPWDISSMELTEGEKTWQFKYAKEKTYNRDGSRISKDWYRYAIKNSNFSAYESIARPGITLKHTNLRLYPSLKEIYYDPNRTGEGFPFDYAQNSAVYINTPLFVSHYSLDKKWVYVKTSYAFGWIKTSDIALVDTEFQNKFRNNKYAVTVKDNLQLLDDGVYLSLVKMGTIFPVDPITKEYLIAKKDPKGYAHIAKVKVKDKDTNIIAYKPIKFNAQNVAYISKQLVGEPYGWGGKLETRDCSALTRDFFAPFGIYLRRNSRQQAQDGEAISIRGLDAETKKEAILANAKPCRSLLFVAGHIMLYLGEKEGEPIILHNYWGVRLKNGDKRVMGRAIITTTKPGIEREDVREKSMLINTLTGIVNF